jgi:hypothetical protein
MRFSARTKSFEHFSVPRIQRGERRGRVMPGPPEKLPEASLQVRGELLFAHAVSKRQKV